MTEAELELYERARELWGAPPSPEAIAVGVLNRFVELQHEAAAAADAAAHRARARELRLALSRLAEGQAVLARELGHAVRSYGGAPPAPEESQERLPCGREAIAYAQSDDQILHAARADLRELERLYGETAAREDTPEDVQRRLQTLAEVQRRASLELPRRP